jgi:hypothetical protein
MDLKDFEQIKRYLHVSYPEPPTAAMPDRDPDTDPDDAVWYRKVAWLFNELTQRFRKYRTVGTRVSIDEAMVMYTGRTLHKYHMSNKPIPEGYKLFVLAERGYVHAIYPDTPVRTSRAGLIVPNDPGNLSHTSQLVIHVLNTLPRHKHHFNVAMDNYFVHPQLFSYLRQEFNMGAYGTLRSGALGDSAIDVSSTLVLPYHFLTGHVVDQDILSIVWMDNAPVKLLTTIHQATGPSALTLKLRKKRSARRCRAPEESVAAVFPPD